MAAVGSVPYLLTMLATYLPPQDPWAIESPMLKPGSVVNFQNSTSVGAYESLTWTWAGLNGEVWESSIWYTYDKEILGGSFVFKRRVKATKDVATLYWQKIKNDTVWLHGKQAIKQPEWKISVRGVVEVSFTPLDRDWVFKVDEDFTYGSSDESQIQDFVDPNPRMRRSPQESDEADTVEASFLGDWIEKIMNFFFGDGSDSGYGRTQGQQSEGIFTRLGNWLRGISCSWHGPCDQPTPSDPPEGPFLPRDPYRPPATFPPMTTSTPVAKPPTSNPDAEPVPEVNDV